MLKQSTAEDEDGGGEKLFEPPSSAPLYHPVPGVSWHDSLSTSASWLFSGVGSQARLTYPVVVNGPACSVRVTSISTPTLHHPRP